MRLENLFSTIFFTRNFLKNYKHLKKKKNLLKKIIDENWKIFNFPNYVIFPNSKNLSLFKKISKIQKTENPKIFFIFLIIYFKQQFLFSYILCVIFFCSENLFLTIFFTRNCFKNYKNF